MDLDDALKTYIIESRELLEQMEDALLRIEQAQDDPEIINAIFRAAHTIKGSAGLFGLETHGGRTDRPVHAGLFGPDFNGLVARQAAAQIVPRGLTGVGHFFDEM
jgi:HPt (histidine-containing phosphotransfer) domain-containing protein